MGVVTKPIVLNDTFSGKMDSLITAIQGISLGNYVVVEINNPRFGIVTGGGIYPVGATCSLVATPSTGCYFLAWKNSNGQIISTNPTYTFNPSDNTYITAMFGDEDVEIVTWNDPNVSKVNAMIQAAYDGKITLSDYWSIGDARTISLSAVTNDEYLGESYGATTIQMVIADFNCKGFKLASDTTVTPLAMVVCKYAFHSGKLHSTNDNSISWASFGRRSWCNDTFVSSMGLAESGIFKQFTWNTLSADETSIESNIDKFAIPNKTILGFNGETQIIKNLYEVWDYFETEENRAQGGYRDFSWLVTKAFPNTTVYSVHGTGDNSYHMADGYGITPFGCI